MAYKFKMPSRFDRNLAVDGVEFHAVDDITGADYGKFTVARWDEDNKRVMQIRERWNEKNARAIRLGKADNKEVALEIFFELLKGWDGPVDENDKPIPYSDEAARAYFDFTNNPDCIWVASYLINECSDILNYQPTKEDKLGN